VNPASDPSLQGYHDKPLAPDMAEKTGMYFFLYFAMTNARAAHDHRNLAPYVHDLPARQGAYTTGHVTYVENFACTGTLRHRLDLLFPLLYLISRY